jgi:Rod binding domain-containing protein
MMGSGAGSDVYGYMLTDAMSQSLAKGGGLGLASVLEQQLTPRASAPAAAAPAKGIL